MKRRKGWHRKKRRLLGGVCAAFVRSYAIGTVGADNSAVRRKIREMLAKAPAGPLDVIWMPKP